MQEKQPETRHTCAYCGKDLHGRSDQVFCNDSCRNTYNRNKRAAEKVAAHENTTEIFRIIKRNYQILKKGSTGLYKKNESGFIPTSEFLSSGINPKFCTSAFTDEDGQLWQCVFERCFTVGGKNTFIKDYPKQTEI